MAKKKSKKAGKKAEKKAAKKLVKKVAKTVKKPAVKGAKKAAKKAAKKVVKAAPAKLVKAPRKAAKKMPAAKAAAPASAPAGINAKQQFLDVYRDECARTLRVLRAYPPEHSGLKPHDRSGSAHQLAFTFGIEQGLVLAALDGSLTMPPAFPPPPATWEEAVGGFEAMSAAVAEAVSKSSDARLMESVQFFTGPKQLGMVPIMNIMWLMLMDQVHHRGQLSVYLRMSGSKVPSIYGPSADEPW